MSTNPGVSLTDPSPNIRRLAYALRRAVEERAVRPATMQSFLSVLVILGALFVMAGNNAEGTPKKVYYAVAAGLWILTVVLAYMLLL